MGQLTECLAKEDGRYVDTALARIFHIQVHVTAATIAAVLSSECPNSIFPVSLTSGRMTNKANLTKVVHKIWPPTTEDSLVCPHFTGNFPPFLLFPNTAYSITMYNSSTLLKISSPSIPLEI